MTTYKGVTLRVEPPSEYEWPHWSTLNQWSIMSAIDSQSKYTAPRITDRNETIRITAPLRDMLELTANSHHHESEMNERLEPGTMKWAASVAVDLGYNILMAVTELSPEDYARWVGRVREAEEFGNIRHDDIITEWKPRHTHERGKPVGYSVRAGKYTNLGRIANFLRCERDEVIRHCMAISLGKYYDERVWKGEGASAGLFAPYLDSIRYGLDHRAYLVRRAIDEGRV